MYKLAISLCLICVANITFAQEQEFEVKKFFTVQDCAPVQYITRLAMNEFGEKPLFYGIGTQTAAETGEDIQSDMMLFVNQDSGSWSLVSRYQEGMGCIVAVGNQFTPYISSSTMVER